MHSCSVRAAGFLQRHVAAYGDWIEFPRFRLTETPRGDIGPANRAFPFGMGDLI